MSIARTRTLDKRYYGVVEALVEEVEGDPDGEGRVKIKFPWFDDNTVTEWCRVRQLHAGDGYGSFILPEKGTEVLVAFIHGDMRRPIILGGLYNGQDKPATKRTKSDDHKVVLRTKYGHELDLNDSSGKESITLKTKKDHHLTLSDEKKLVTLTTSSGIKAEFDEDKKTITITTGSDQVIIDGNSKKVTVKSTTVILDGSSVKLGGDSASQAVILGDMFMTLFNTHTHTTALGPTSPPTPPIIPQAVLSFTTKTS